MKALLVTAAAVVLTSGCSDSKAGTRSVKLPPSAGIFDYQIGGAYDPVSAVQIVDRDRLDDPASGKYNVCYVNAFQTQPDQSRFWLSRHRGVLLKVGGKFVHDPNWPGEYILDTGTLKSRAVLLVVIGKWIDKCAKDGYDAVEADNLDSWTRTGVRSKITRADNIAMARLLVKRAHDRGLAIAQKNTIEINGKKLGFDFAIVEECQKYKECDKFAALYGRRVVEVEYTDNPITFYKKACAARAGAMSILLRDRNVVAQGKKAYRYQYC